MDLYCNAGNSLDLSYSIMDRALLHCDVTYRIPAVRAQGHICKTNLPSHTAFRGFGGPQACFYVWRPALPLPGGRLHGWPGSVAAELWMHAASCTGGGVPVRPLRGAPAVPLLRWGRGAGVC